MQREHERRGQGQPADESQRTKAAAGGLSVERGPDWLFVRVHGGDARGHRLAETVWGMLRENLMNRIVLEMESVGTMDEELLTEISTLGSRVRADGGLIRICGLSDANLSRLEASPAAAQLPHFSCRTDAVRAACR